MTLLVYDYEVYKYDWCVTILDLFEQKYTYIENDEYALREFHRLHEDSIWIGYNNRHYDQWIHKAILCGFDPKEVNDFIIVKDQNGYFFSDLFKTIKMINYDVMAKNDRGLKSLEAFMGDNIHESSIDFTIDRKLTREELDENKKYNKHDVDETAKVFIERYNEFEAHLGICKIFNRPLSDMGKSQAQLAAKILMAGGAPHTADEWDIFMPDTLQLTKYRYVADWFMMPENHTENSSLTTKICGEDAIFAWGGLHQAIPQFVYTCKPDELMIMFDAAQLYPTIMLEYHLLSRNCPSSAYDILKDTLETSLRLKAEHKKKEREPYKRINNIYYGAQGDKFNALYDPRNRNLICVFGQVLILDLIEKIEEAGIIKKLVQINTDGVEIIINRKDFDLFDDIVYAWEQRVHLTMEFDFFKTCYQGDVNNYLQIEYDGGYKAKGAYVKSLSCIDYDLPIVNKAIRQFLISGVPVEKTINDCDDLIEFQKVFKLSSKYKYCYHNGKLTTERVNRVFASKNTEDTYLGKQKAEGATIEKFANCPEHCFINNNDIHGVKIQDEIDKDWYINLAKERIKDKFNIE